MARRVVYFLGAGFSQPLGVPTIREFLDRARDQQSGHSTGKYAYFGPLLKRVEGLYKAGSFFDSDMRNIEEILSLLEADAFVNEPDLKDQFIKFICDVITFHTPPLASVKPPDNWQGFVFGGATDKWNAYGYFTLALLRLQLGRNSQSRKLVVSDENGPSTSYSVVTTNYDLVLENVCDYLNTDPNFESDKKRGFHVASGKKESRLGTVPLAKLHGSVDDCDIVPPTWSKGATPEYAVPWNLALEALSQAQEIRIVGYSLPEGDSYVRYLLKAAAIRNPDLRKVHVVCLDPNDQGGVEARYRGFVKQGLWFTNMDSGAYLQNLYERVTSGQQQGSLTHMLELTHRNFFQSH